MKLDDVDTLYLISDFLEEMLDRNKDREGWGMDLEQQDQHADEECMYEMTIELVKKLIKEKE